MDEHPGPPQSLLALTNWNSRALQPIDVWKPEFVRWAHDHGAYLYMVLVGPKTEIVELVDESHWKVRTLFHDGGTMKPRMIPVPFDLLPREGTALVEGAVNWTDAEGHAQRSNAVEIARWVLQRGWLPGQTPDQSWYPCTRRKFFTYRVEYIGRAYGKNGERTAAERIGAGHKTVQQVLGEMAAYYPYRDVALILLDVNVQSREASFSLDSENFQDLARLLLQFVSEPDGPLIDLAKLVTAAEAMLIRSFPDARNQQYKGFPRRDAPSLVSDLLEAGITHLGVQLDVSRSFALIQHPDEGREPSERLRFAVNLETGMRETLKTSAPLSWQTN